MIIPWVDEIGKAGASRCFIDYVRKNHGSRPALPQKLQNGLICFEGHADSLSLAEKMGVLDPWDNLPMFSAE